MSDSLHARGPCIARRQPFPVAWLGHVLDLGRVSDVGN